MMNKIEKKPVALEINLDNLAHNFLEVKRIVGENTKIMGIVKANSYGHGSVDCAKVFIKNGADYIGVSTLSEAIELRHANIKSKILLLNYTPRSNFHKLLEYDLIQTIYNYEDAKYLSELALKMNEVARIHIKIDTGMTRLGFLPKEESFEQILKISNFPNIYIELSLILLHLMKKIKPFLKNNMKSLFGPLILCNIWVYIQGLSIFQVQLL